jgi:hypothetical protein
MENVQTELQDLLIAFLSKNPGPEGEDKLARELDASIPTIRRWANGTTHPHPAMAKLLIERLKSILQAG